MKRGGIRRKQSFGRKILLASVSNSSSKVCATVEEMGRKLVGGFVDQSLRVRYIIRHHFLLNGASVIRELPPRNFVGMVWFLGKLQKLVLEDVQDLNLKSIEHNVEQIIDPWRNQTYIVHVFDYEISNAERQTIHEICRRRVWDQKVKGVGIKGGFLFSKGTLAWYTTF